VEGGDDASERRQQGERRERSEGSGRRGAPRATSTLAYVLRALGAIAALLVVIIFAVRTTRPIYATRGTLGEELRKHAPDAAAVLTPSDSSDVDRLMATPKFQAEKRNFYEDVMRLKQVDSARADSIAQYAVREGYVRGISPAIIFGVMLTENAKFVSKALSNVGAVGLMQVYPKIWLNKEMTQRFGSDLASDSTNVKYGVFILSRYFQPKVKGGTTQTTDWQTALLHYNGCVRGTNTPRCHTYPGKVRNFVEGQAKSICNGRGFYECIAKPFIDGFTGGGASGGDGEAAKPTR
jgi:soluble lytic murein transglycosylase-like protein